MVQFYRTIFNEGGIGLLMEKQCWEYLIEAVITFGATFAGVYWAIQADNAREKEEQKRQEDYTKHLKERLVFSLLTEIKGIQAFCNSNGGQLFVRSPYSFETGIIETTAQDQVKYFENQKLLNLLYELREKCRGVHQTIEAITKPAINFGVQEEGRWQSNWQQYKESLKRLTPILQKLLRDEYTGELTDEYRAVCG